MRLHKVEISNYRSIKELEFTFPRSGFLVLVGANNAGKSNVIRAIDNLCGDTWFGKDKTQDHDFYLRNRANNISIRLTFDDESTASWDSNGKWPSFEDARGRRRHDQLKDTFPCVYLAADRTFDKQMAFYDHTLLGRIRRTFQAKAKPVEQELRAKFEELITIFNRVEGFTDFTRDFAELFSAMQADTDACLSIDFKPYTPSNYFKTMQIVAEDPDIGQKLDLDELGEGTRNMVLLALLRSYAKNFRGAGNELTGILALEEPEIYLHPQARRHLFRTLREIAQAGMQVVISTHSSSFIDTEFFDSIGRIVKIPDEENTGRKCTTLNKVSRRELVDICTKTGVPAGKTNRDNITEFYKTTSNPMLNEGFFARCVVLVEGDTEELALPVLLSARGVDCDLLGISVISVRGKNQIPKYWRLFRAFDIPTLAIVDNDDDASKEKRRSNQGIADCFGVELPSLLDVEIAKVVRRNEAPTGAIIVLERDYESSLAKDAEKQIPGISADFELWETEAKDLIRPVGSQNKGQVARYIARKFVAKYPDFEANFVQLVVGELKSLGVTGRRAATSTPPEDALETTNPKGNDVEADDDWPF